MSNSYPVAIIIVIIALYVPVIILVPHLPVVMSSGKRQASRPSEPATKRRRGRTRDSGSSSNGESSSDRPQQSRQALQQQQQQQQQQRPASPPTVTSLPAVNPASSRPTPVAIPAWQSRSMDGGDQIAPTSPRTSRRTASLHVIDQVAPDKPMDPIMQHQVSSLPKESFKLCNTDFIW